MPNSAFTPCSSFSGSLLLVLALSAGAAYAQAVAAPAQPAVGQRLALNGLRVGMTLAELESTAAGTLARCKESAPALKMSTCYWSRRDDRPASLKGVADRPVDSWLIVHDGSHVVSIQATFPVEAFDALHTMFTAQWGSAHEGLDSLSKREDFDKISLVWREPSKQLRLQKRAGLGADVATVVLSP